MNNNALLLQQSSIGSVESFGSKSPRSNNNLPTEMSMKNMKKIQQVSKDITTFLNAQDFKGSGKKKTKKK